MPKKSSSETASAEPANTSKSKPLPQGAKIAIGCVGILVIISILIGIAGRVIFSKFGFNFMKKAVETKTGVSMDASGKTMTIRDQKTGAEINVGQNKLPDGFPKDFPLYPNAQIAGNISGTENKAGKGYWVIMTSTDDAAKVTAFYDAELPKAGWTIDNTMDIGSSATRTVTKGSMTGTVIMGAEEKEKGTSIVITIAPKEATPTETAE